MYEVRNQTAEQEGLVTDALGEDVGALGDAAGNDIKISRQRYTDSDLEDFGQDYTIANLAQIRIAGAHQLPAVAWLYDQIVIKLGLVRFYVDSGFGDRQVLRSSYPQWDEALQELETAVVQCRDALADIAEDLVTVATDYAEADNTTAEMMEIVDTNLDMYEQVGDPVFRGEERRTSSDWESATGETVREGGHM